MGEPAWPDATARAELMRKGEASPRELVDAAIARIVALNPHLDAVTWTRFAQAREEALGAPPDGTLQPLAATTRARAARGLAEVIAHMAPRP